MKRIIPYYEEWRARDETHRRMIASLYKFAANPANDGKTYDDWEIGKKICGGEEAYIKYLESWA